MAVNVSIRSFVIHGQSALRDTLASVVACVLAWVFARHLLGHEKPVFAAVTAIVCLAPGLPDHARQAVGLMLGVMTGIIIGEVAWMVPEGVVPPELLPLFRLALAVFFSMLVASGFGLAPVVPIQAGVSAVLVLAMGPENAGLNRMLDVGVGVAIGLTFSQILWTPDPLSRIMNSVDAVFRQFADVLDTIADAVEKNDADRGEAALRRITVAQGSLTLLHAALASSRQSVRWSLRGRAMADEVRTVAARYETETLRLYAVILLLTESCTRGIRSGETSPASIVNGLRMLATMAHGKGSCPPNDGKPVMMASLSAVGGCWQESADYLRHAAALMQSGGDDRPMT